MHTVLLVLILILASYIIYLHVKLVRKNLIIEGIIKKISGIEKQLSVDEIRKVISDIHNFNGKALMIDDKLFDEEVSGFIMTGLNESATFIHYTMSEDVAAAILKEGFRFVESFYKTALRVNNDKLDLMIKHNSKKLYGDFIVVISISNEIISFYSGELDKEGINSYKFENILTLEEPLRNENSDITYTLAPQFIKGYLNYRTGIIHANPDFNPAFISPVFSENIKNIKSKSF